MWRHGKARVREGNQLWPGFPALKPQTSAATLKPGCDAKAQSGQDAKRNRGNPPEVNERLRPPTGGAQAAIKSFKIFAPWRLGVKSLLPGPASGGAQPRASRKAAMLLRKAAMAFVCIRQGGFIQKAHSNLCLVCSCQRRLYSRGRTKECPCPLGKYDHSQHFSPSLAICEFKI